MLTASDTAYSIAVIRAQEAELAEGERLFEDPFASIFAAAGEHAREGIERFLALPFFREGIRLRTRHIDDVVVDALSHGTGQLVLMGAGFDARGLRLSPAIAGNVQTFEVDMPALLERKRALLAASGIAASPSVHHVACDFMGDFEGELTSNLVAQGFERERPAMFVWEGVLPYITHEAIDRCLRFMASIGAPGSRLIFDFSDYTSVGELMPERARRAGFTAFDEIVFDELWRRHLAGEPLPSAFIMKLGIASK